MPDTQILGIPADFEAAIERTMLPDINADPDGIIPHLTAAQVAAAYVATLNDLIRELVADPAEYIWGPRPILDETAFIRRLDVLVAGERRRRFEASDDRHAPDVAFDVAAECVRALDQPVVVTHGPDGYRLHFRGELSYDAPQGPAYRISASRGQWDVFVVRDLQTNTVLPTAPRPHRGRPTPPAENAS